MNFELDHPDAEHLLRFSRLTAEVQAGMADIAAHVASCPGCRMRVDAMAGWDAAIDASRAASTPAQVDHLAADVFRDGLAAAHVAPLVEMPMPDATEPVRLAADGSEHRDEVVNLATFYCESPDAVLRIMRDRVSGDLQIHLITSPPELAAFAMVNSVRNSTMIYTDKQGRATIDGDRSADLTMGGLCLHLPFARLELEPASIPADGYIPLDMTDGILRQHDLPHAPYTLVQRDELIGSGDLQLGQPISVSLSDPITPVTMRLYMNPHA